ncbi:MAG TPA: hypothetical protein VNB67_07545 [Nitrososphaeraceae archaeon]|nr:hypothetical protein [Nitrososphaeraceae archaeon]
MLGTVFYQSSMLTYDYCIIFKRAKKKVLFGFTRSPATSYRLWGTQLNWLKGIGFAGNNAWNELRWHY